MMIGILHIISDLPYCNMFSSIALSFLRPLKLLTSSFLSMEKKPMRTLTSSSVIVLTVEPSIPAPPYARKSSSARVAKSSAAVDLPPRGSPSLTF